MKKFIFTVLAGMLFWTVSAAEFVLSDKYTIVIPENASKFEKFSARQLQKYLKQSTGVMLEVKSSGTPALFVRHDKTLPVEKWKIFADQNGNLHITGGYSTGVLFAVYEFLEKVIGVRFLAPDAEFVPQKHKFSFSSDLKIDGEPFFKRREIYLAVMRKHGEYLGKMRLSNIWIEGEQAYPLRFGSTGMAHTYHVIARNFPKDKMEYFSLTKDGQRFRFRNGRGPGQFCLTHPEVRHLVAESIIKFIRKDRRDRDIAPIFYALSKNDNSDDCVCKNCLAVVKKYQGNHTGLNLEFVSDVARRVGKIYPDVVIRTGAYLSDEMPVDGFKLPENVMIGIAQLGSEFKTGINRDSLRELTHPNNKDALDILLKWRKSSPLMIWDYWVLFRQQYGVPAVNVSAIAANLKLYAKKDIRYFFAESELSPHNMISFIDLRHYVASKLMIDPDADLQKLKKEFMTLYYGPAAEEMTAYLDYLETRMKEENGRLGYIPPNAWSYLDKKFFAEAEKILSRAEKSAAGNPQYLERIGQERIPVDNALLCLGERKGVKVDKKQLINRLQRNMKAYIRKYGDELRNAGWEKFTSELISYYACPPPLPEQFENKKVFDFHSSKLKEVKSIVEKVEDKDSVVGTALRLSDLAGRKKNDPTFHRTPLVFSLRDMAGKKTLLRYRVKNIPQDGKYHLYRIGKSKLTANSQLILHWSWWLNQSSPSNVFDPIEANARYEIWVSVKFTGKPYVKGSNEPGAIWLDRILFVEESEK